MSLVPPLSSAGGGFLAGDVTGAPGANTVQRLQGFDVAGNTPTQGQVLTCVGTTWIPKTPSTASTLVVSGSTYTPVIAARYVGCWIATPGAGFTVAAPTATPSGSLVDFDVLIIRIKSATARAITWNTAYISSGGATLPTVSVATKTITLGFHYNATRAKWVLMALTAAGY